MSQMRRRQPKYRHVAPALLLLTAVVAAMTGITVTRLARITAHTAASVPPAAMRVVSVPRAEAASVAKVAPTLAAPAPIVEAESPAPSLSTATPKVAPAAARSRTLAAASPKSAPPAECDRATVENYDPDIAGMTGLPGRTMYYARGQKKQKNALAALASACGRTAQTANSTP
jgi:hypothetical protein